MSPRKLLRDSLGLALSNYLARGVLIGRGVISAAVLGPHGYGGWNALNLILDYGSNASCGALQGLDLELPAARSGSGASASAPPAGDPARARRLLEGAWWVIVAGGILFTLAVLVAVAGGHPAVAHGLGLGPPLLMIAAALLQLAIQYHGSALRARGCFGPVSRATALQVLVGGGAGIALVRRFGIDGLLWGWLAGTALALLLLRRAEPAPLVPRHPAVGWALMRAGFPVFAFFTASLVLRSVDRLALIRHGDAAGLGHYSFGLVSAGLVLYLPDAAGRVLYPRVAAAAHAGLAPAGVRLEVARAQRALAVTLPLAVALALPWAPPLTARLLPAFRPGVPALEVLALGALMLGAATVPLPENPWLTVFDAAVAAASAVLVFGVAARAPRPLPVALAATAGYALFGIGMVVFAARELFERPVERRAFLIASFVPALWASALVLAALAFGPSESWTGALARSAAVLLGYLPALGWFGRGLGLVRLVREWLIARPAPA